MSLKELLGFQIGLLYAGLGGLMAGLFGCVLLLIDHDKFPFQVAVLAAGFVFMASMALGGFYMIATGIRQARAINVKR